MSAGVEIPLCRELDHAYAISPYGFVEAITGPFNRISNRPSVRLVEVPSEYVVGAPWRGHKLPTQIDARRLFNKFDQGTIEYDTTCGSLSNWLTHLPIVWAGEGKNRIQLYRRFGQPLLTNLTRHHFPKPCELSLRRVRCSQNWVLECHSKKYLDRSPYGALHVGERRFLLPFPQYSVPLFRSYGVSMDSPVMMIFAERQRREGVIQILRNTCGDYRVDPWAA